MINLVRVMSTVESADACCQTDKLHRPLRNRPTLSAIVGHESKIDGTACSRPTVAAVVGCALNYERAELASDSLQLKPCTVSPFSRPFEVIASQLGPEQTQPRAPGMDRPAALKFNSTGTSRGGGPSSRVRSPHCAGLQMARTPGCFSEDREARHETKLPLMNNRKRPGLFIPCLKL